MEGVGSVGSLKAGLYLVSTPIGHRGDITLRALDTLREVEAVVCEDTRVTGLLLHYYGIKKPLLLYHDHSGERVRTRLVERLRCGGSLALVCDAGTPLISDPGYKLVRECLELGVRVTAIPGANAAILAVTISGLPTDKILFSGFLSSKQSERRSELEKLSGYDVTLVIYESTRRLPSLLQDLSTYMRGREAVVARELTKFYEEVRRGKVEVLAREFVVSRVPKGEVVVVVGPPKGSVGTDQGSIDRALRESLRGRSVSKAVSEVSERYGWSRGEVYRRAIVLSEEEKQRRGARSVRYGRWAEWLVRWMLRFKGYRILETRFRTSGGEIDIIAKRRDVVVVVEVKARRDRERAYESITSAQRRRLVQTLKFFLKRNPSLIECTIRFDVVIVVPGRLPHHIQNAFEEEF